MAWINEEQQKQEWTEWKDRVNTEPELRERVGLFHLVLDQWPENEQQLTTFEEEYAKNKAQGEANYLTMPRFNRRPKCPKCGNEDVDKFHVHFIPVGAAKTSCVSHAGLHEHMHRGCDGCGYHWSEKPLSDEEFGGWAGHDEEMQEINGG